MRKNCQNSSILDSENRNKNLFKMNKSVNKNIVRVLTKVTLCCVPDNSITANRSSALAGVLVRGRPLRV